jgi:hypothetical protein
MKAKFFVTVLLLFCIGCTSQRNEELTQPQKDEIKNELKAIIDSIVVNFEELDPEGALWYYSPELVAVAETGLIDFQTYSKNWIDWNRNVASIKWTTSDWRCTVLSNDLAISVLVGKLEIALKSGVRITANPHFYSDICKRIDGQWKIIYEHGSHESTAVTIVKPGKK